VKRVNQRDTIEILHTDECPFWEETLRLIEKAVTESGMKIHVKTTRISSVAEAKRLGFPGSPTVRINGVDVDPATRETEGYMGCRIYRYQDRMFEYPPEAMIKSAIDNIVKK
jgi:hypothetical protein